MNSIANRINTLDGPPLSLVAAIWTAHFKQTTYTILSPLSCPSEHLATFKMVEINTAAPPLRIGTRRSNLAIIQAEGIRNSLQKVAPHRTFEIEALRTLGDKDKTTALYNFGAKSLWTSELEEKLTSGELDVVVHCLKGPLLFPFLYQHQ
jgi:hypothetical protein